MQGFHAVVLLCAPCYRVSTQYLCDSWSAVPPVPSSCVATPGRTYTSTLQQNSNLGRVIIIVIFHHFLPHHHYRMELDSNVIGMTFAGPNVQAASVILGNGVHQREQIKQKLQELKKLHLSEKKSVAFMFACVGRGSGYYEEENVESSVFREVFPNTPLFGFFGNGEIGCDNLTCGKADDEASPGSKCSNGTRLPDIIHGYTTIFCLLSFGKPS